MHLNGTAVRARHQDGPVSPVISGENGWLGDDGRHQPLTLELSLPVSAEEMAAALYGDDHLSPIDLGSDVNVWAFAAVAIVQDGLNVIQHRADEILVAETRGKLANPAWLELRRRRVAEVSGGAATGPAATSVSIGPTARAGSQPPSTTTFPRPGTSEEAVPSGPGAGPGSLAYGQALTDIASPCGAGN
jgi:hypothetical protein